MADSLPTLLQQISYGAILLLLVAVTGGVGYLTVAEWRDRRRRRLIFPSESKKRRSPR
jgi:hypothetical protein